MARRVDALFPDVYRDALNTPAFLAMLPAIGGLLGLDLRCGKGSNTRKLAQLGARTHAIDIASTFTRHARATEEADPLGILFNVADAVSLPFADRTFDFATAFMSMMDGSDQSAALREVSLVLRPGVSCSSLSLTRALIRRTAACCGRTGRPRPSRSRGPDKIGIGRS